MEKSFVQLIDLSDEILMNIFKQISHIDVLYSLIGVNKRLNNIVHDSIFTSYLKLMVFCPYCCIYHPLPDSILDRFCLQILPEIHNKIQSLDLESSSMERILLTTNYPNLYRLGLHDLDIKKAKDFFTDKTSVIHKFKNQISSLVIYITNGECALKEKKIIEHIFTEIFMIFNKLQYLDFGLYSITFQQLFFSILPPTVFSSTLLELHINVDTFNDCLHLLDGRFNQLHSFKVNIEIVRDNTQIDNKTKLPNLRYFSLHCKHYANYDTTIKPLLHRMINLERLNLSFSCETNRFIDGNELKINIINYMKQLNKFTFNIFSSTGNLNQIDLRSNDDIHQTFKHFKDYEIISCIDYFQEKNQSQCYIYTYPYQLTYYYNITNNFPGGLFKNVCSISLFDERPFEHEFFLQIAQSFPFLEELNLANEHGQNNKQCQKSNKDHQTLSIIEYPYLTQINFHQIHEDYLEQFLLDTKTYLPYNVHLSCDYQLMKKVTQNFQREATQINCSKVHYIVYTISTTQLPKHFNDYFLSTDIHL